MYRYLDVDPGDGTGADIQYFSGDPVDLSGWTQTKLSAQPASVAPPRWDGFRPVLFLHGYNTLGHDDCAGWWNTAKSYYDNLGYDTSDLKTVGYYTADANCDLDGDIGLTSNDNTPIQELGRRLAWTIFYEYSMFGRTVDVIAHSMGGLVIRAAITGTRNPPSGQAWPPYIYVEDVSTLGTAHDGASDWYPCIGAYNDTQCRDLDPDAAFIGWIQAHPNPQANGSGTDWTLIGAGDDGAPTCCVASASALDTGAGQHAGHKILYVSGQGLEHNVLPYATSGTYDQRYCHFYMSSICNMTNTATWVLDTDAAPVVRAADGNRYSTGW